MFRQKMCLNLSESFHLPNEEQLKLFKQVGFDAFFPCYTTDEALFTVAKSAQEAGLEIQSVHAPFGYAADVWREGEKGEAALQDLIACVKASGKVGAPIVVIHPYIGFYTGETPTTLGLSRYEKLVAVAKEANVKLAFENVEGEEFLAAIMEHFKGDETVGFCWDSGHEQCYNWGKDMLAVYGDRLLCTHLDDNLGISRLDGKIYFTDDLHLLPFDGVVDWRDAAKRLNDAGYFGTLTFEMKISNSPNRHEHDGYMKMTTEEYVTQVYARACRFAEIKRRDAEKRK
jgi:sugar phosphate isomerase/epimerase